MLIHITQIKSVKVEYSTALGMYYTMNAIKRSFFMPELSSIRIITHRFHVDDDGFYTCIGYVMIIVQDPMMQLGLMGNFNHGII